MEKSHRLHDWVGLLPLTQLFQVCFDPPSVAYLHRAYSTWFYNAFYHTALSASGGLQGCWPLLLLSLADVEQQLTFEGEKSKGKWKERSSFCQYEVPMVHVVLTNIPTFGFRM